MLGVPVRSKVQFHDFLEAVHAVVQTDRISGRAKAPYDFELYPIRLDHLHGAVVGGNTDIGGTAFFRHEGIDRIEDDRSIPPQADHGETNLEQGLPVGHIGGSSRDTRYPVDAQDAVRGVIRIRMRAGKAGYFYAIILYPPVFQNIGIKLHQERHLCDLLQFFGGYFDAHLVVELNGAAAVGEQLEPRGRTFAHLYQTRMHHERDDVFRISGHVDRLQFGEARGEVDVGKLFTFPDNRMAELEDHRAVPEGDAGHFLVGPAPGHGDAALPKALVGRSGKTLLAQVPQSSRQYDIAIAQDCRIVLHSQLQGSQAVETGDKDVGTDQVPRIAAGLAGVEMQGSHTSRHDTTLLSQADIGTGYDRIRSRSRHFQRLRIIVLQDGRIFYDAY